MADAIVLAGTAAVEKAAKDAGFNVEVPFTGGRGDATQDWTDVESFAVMEPAADGFRNYLKTKHSVKTEELLIDRASLLGLSAPEMAVLLGGLRVLGANHNDAPHGVFTTRKGQLTNDFFVNLLDNDTFWQVVDESGDEEFIGYDRGGKQEKWRATRTDLIFGSNSQLRADRRGLCREGQRREVRTRLHRGLDEGHECRPLRSAAKLGQRRADRHRGTGDGQLVWASACRGTHFSPPPDVPRWAEVQRCRLTDCRGMTSRTISRRLSASSWNSFSRGLERRQISATWRKP